MKIDEFIIEISKPRLEGMFNPWSQQCENDINPKEYLSRRKRLRDHLDCAGPRFLIIGEAPGYQGCRFSGIAFTSERLLLNGSIPRIPLLQARITNRQLPWSEPSATIVWSTLYDLNIAETTILFNAVPWHPEGKKGALSNRTPTSSEKAIGNKYLDMFLSMYPRSKVVALGNTASSNLEELGVYHTKVRHPANGGARKFREGLRQLI